MSDIEIHHLGAAYALDALDQRERSAFEAHYTNCEICRSDVRDNRDTAAELGSLTSVMPSSELKSRLMSEIATTRQLSPLPGSVVRLADRRPSRAMKSVLAVAAAALLFVAGALAVSGRDSGSRFGDELAAIVASPDGNVARLAGEGSGAVTVAWASGRAALVGTGMAEPGDGKAYELWLIDGEGAHPMRVLDHADGGKIEQIVSIDGTPAAWGITIEPEQGSDTPTEPILYVAEVTA